jgi:hypothetical protein
VRETDRDVDCCNSHLRGKSGERESEREREETSVYWERQDEDDLVNKSQNYMVGRDGRSWHVSLGKMLVSLYLRK